jgi:hypothetical protein
MKHNCVTFSKRRTGGPGESYSNVILQVAAEG